jgi:hypothetical protein
MATSKERDREKEYTAMKTPPIVSPQEWGGCAAVAAPSAPIRSRNQPI